MRISIREDDPGYLAYCELVADGKSAHPFLNGVEQRECITADEEAGEILRFQKTAAGNIVTDPAKGEVLTETVKGIVRVDLR